MKKGTILITLGLLLITAALCLTGYNFYESYRAGKASEAIMEELDAAMTGQGSGEHADSDQADGSAGDSSVSDETIADSVTGKKKNMGDLYPNRDMPTTTIDGIDYIGWIEIPSLNLRLPVQAEWVYDLLEISPSRYSGSVYQNNMIIGGHSYITHFRNLRNIAPGTRVIFYDTEGYSYEYEVDYVMTLNPNQGEILSDEESEEWDLTLFTCNTGGQTRCVVRCVRVEV